MTEKKVINYGEMDFGKLSQEYKKIVGKVNTDVQTVVKQFNELEKIQIEMKARLDRIQFNVADYYKFEADAQKEKTIRQQAREIEDLKARLLENDADLVLAKSVRGVM